MQPAKFNKDKIIRLFEEQKYKELLEIAEQMLKLDKKNESALLFKAEIQFKAGQLIDSLKILDSLLKINPENTGANYQKSMILFILQRNEEALEFCDKALAKEKNNFNLLLIKAGILKQMNYDKKEVNKCIEKAKKIDKKRTEEFLKKYWS